MSAKPGHASCEVYWLGDDRAGSRSAGPFVSLIREIVLRK